MSGNWTLDGLNVLLDGEYIGTFDSTRKMEEFVGRMQAEIELRTQKRFPGMYSDAEQEVYVLGVMRNLHKSGTVIRRGELVRMACRSYRGINAKELTRILERLLEKGYISHQMCIVDSKNKIRTKRTQPFYALNSMTKEYDYAAQAVSDAVKSEGQKAFEQTVRVVGEKLKAQARMCANNNDDEV